MIYIKPKPVTHTHTQTHKLATAVWLKNHWKSSLWWLLDLLLLSVEFHLWERNDELSQFLSLCKRQQSHAVWYSYGLFRDQKLLQCKGDLTRRMYTVRYQNVAKYFGAYRPNGIPTNFQKQPTNTAIHCLCYRHKHAHIDQKICTYWYQFCKYKSIGGSYLQVTTGQTVSDRTHRW